MCLKVFVKGDQQKYDELKNDAMKLGSAFQKVNFLRDLKADFEDRIDLKARFNANLGNVINISDNFDVYPGISLSLKNFGGHLGMRYFFSDGFGLFTEFGTTFAKYNSEALTPAEKINNQFNANIGAVFNL